MDVDLTTTIQGTRRGNARRANELKFEQAALLRDQIKELKRMTDGGTPAKRRPAKLSKENTTSHAGTQ